MRDVTVLGSGVIGLTTALTLLDRGVRALASASGDATIRLWDTLPLCERRALGGK